MTIQELEQTAATLAAVDAQLASTPATGRVAQEIGAVREHLDGAIKLTANAIRQQRATEGASQ